MHDVRPAPWSGCDKINLGGVLRLINKINSVSQSNSQYEQQLKRGYELLKAIGYK
jgi:hypothetical protein